MRSFARSQIRSHWCARIRRMKAGSVTKATIFIWDGTASSGARLTSGQSVQPVADGYTEARVEDLEAAVDALLQDETH